MQVFTSSRQSGRSLDDCVESLGSERGIVTRVEVDVALERAVGVERGPAAPAHVVVLVGALPRELDGRPAITIRVAAVESSRHRDEAQIAEATITELDKAGLDAVNPVLLWLAEEAELVERDGEDLAPGEDAGWLSCSGQSPSAALRTV